MIDETTWIAVSQPALVIVRQVGEDLAITASDPRQLHVAHDRSEPPRGRPRSEVAGGRTTTRITMALPAAPNGASATATYLPGADPVVVPVQADATVRTGTYANSSDGSSETLSIQNYTTGFTRESFVRFDTSAIEGEILSAEVRLMAVSGTSPVLIAAAPAASDTWQESSITWNSRPASGPEIGRASVKQGEVAGFDVTSLVREAVSSDDQLSLRLFSPTMSYYLLSFASREHANASFRPVLEVITRPITPDVPDLPEGESLVLGPMRLADYLNLSLGSSASSPVYGPLPAPPPPSGDRRSTLRIGAAGDGDVWDPSLVDLALGEY